MLNNDDQDTDIRITKDDKPKVEFSGYFTVDDKGFPKIVLEEDSGAFNFSRETIIRDSIQQGIKLIVDNNESTKGYLVLKYYP